MLIQFRKLKIIEHYYSVVTYREMAIRKDSVKRGKLN
jgi:hypothetical protein